MTSAAFFVLDVAFFEMEDREVSVGFSYIAVILIWSTTPLAIKWSGEGSGFLFGVTGRMVLGAVLALVVMQLMRLPFPWHRRALD